MTPVAVPADRLDEWLPLIGWHLEQFAESGEWTPQDLISHIRDRTRQLWVAWDGQRARGVVLTNVGDDRLKTVRITHVAGDGYREWAHLRSVIKAWAREIGAQRIEAVARPGWERIAREMRKTHVVLEERL